MLKRSRHTPRYTSWACTISPCSVRVWRGFMLGRNLLLAALFAIATRAAAPDGEALYKQRCGGCHDGRPQPRMPGRQELSARTPEAIYQAMFEGAMKPQSAGLSSDEGRAVARFLTAKEFGTRVVVAALAGRCSAAPGPLRLSAVDWNGWGYDAANTRHQPNPGIDAAEVPRLKLKWAFAFAGDTVRSAQPSVVGD